MLEIVNGQKEGVDGNPNGAGGGGGVDQFRSYIR